MEDDPDLLREISAAIRAVHSAFGAPGNYGYDTPEGAALFGLYKAGAALMVSLSAPARGGE